MKHILLLLIFLLAICDCQSQELMPFRIDTLWGYKDKQGEIKIEPQFQYASKFMGDVAIVAINDKLGAIDKGNKQIIPFRYEFLQPLDSLEFLFGYRAKYFGEHIMGVMSKNEEIKIPAGYSYISKYRNTYKVTKNQDSIIGKNAVGDVRSVRTTYGLFDGNGKVLIPCKFNSIGWLNDSLLMVDSASLSADGKFSTPNYALFNINGDQLTEFKYMVFAQFSEGLAKARIGERFGFIFPNGQVAIPIQFDYCEDFSNGYAAIKQGDKWGAIDKTGKIIIEPTKEYKEVKAELKKKYGN